MATRVVDRSTSFVTVIILLFSSSSAIFNTRELSNIQLTEAVGQRIVLPCNSTVEGPVRWCLHRTPESECDEVAVHGQVANGQTPHRSFYELQNNDLIVKSANFSIAGDYDCIEENGQGDRHRVRLQIIEPETTEPHVNIVSQRPPSDSGDAQKHDVSCDYASSSANIYIGVCIALIVVAVAAVLAFFVLLALYMKIRKTRTRNMEERQELMNDSINGEHWDKAVEEFKKTLPNNDNDFSNWTSDKFMFTVIRRPELYKVCIAKIVEHIEGLGGDRIDVIVGINVNDSRADLFAAPIAAQLGKPYVSIVAAESGAESTDVLIRKTYTSAFEKATTIEVERGACSPGQKVILIDSYLRKGRSTQAAMALIKHDLKAEVVECIVVADVKETRDDVPKKLWSLFHHPKA